MSPTALVFEERHYTLPQLEALADGLATSLRERGVLAGDRVALMSSNRPEFVVALHAIWRLAAVFVPEIPRLPSGKVLRRVLKERYGCTSDS